MRINRKYQPKHRDMDKPEGWVKRWLRRKLRRWIARNVTEDDGLTLISRCSDGSSVLLSGYSGGAHPDGLWSHLELIFRDAQGMEVRRSYRAEVEWQKSGYRFWTCALPNGWTASVSQHDDASFTIGADGPGGGRGTRDRYPTLEAAQKAAVELALSQKAA